MGHEAREIMYKFWDTLRNVSAVLLILGIVCVVQLLQADAQLNRSTSGKTYSNIILGFRYLPPNEMKDETASGRAEIRVRAATRPTNNTLDLLLSMSSRADATASNWYSLTIESYPRKMFSNLDDQRAEAKMSAWVAGTSSLPGKPRSTVLAGQTFAVFVFGEQNGLTRKGAVIWTTIRKGKLLSFAFVANSPEQLKRLTETMKSVQFY